MPDKGETIAMKKEQTLVSLDDLATRIRTEHAAVSIALKQSLEHAMVAGDLLIEAKRQVSHGEWLPWLSDHCMISERTAQLYMRVATLSSNVRKLFRFIKDIEGQDDPEQIIKAAIDANVGVIVDKDYNPFADRSDAEQREWIAFINFLAERNNYSQDGARMHVDWIMQRPFQNVDEWLGEEGEKYRKPYGWRFSPALIKNWKVFLDQHAKFSMTELIQQGEQQYEREQATTGNWLVQATTVRPKVKQSRNVKPRKTASKAA